MKRETRKRNEGATRRGQVIVYAVAAFLTLLGLADATYLTVQHLTGATAVCGNSTGCFQVLGSKYSHLGPVPVAALGAIAYFSAFSLATFAAFGSAQAKRYFTWNVWALFLAALGLLFVQAFVLHAFCRYCLFSAAVTFLLTGLVIANTTGDGTAR